MFDVCGSVRRFVAFAVGMAEHTNLLGTDTENLVFDVEQQFEYWSFNTKQMNLSSKVKLLLRNLYAAEIFLSQKWNRNSVPTMKKRLQIFEHCRAG